MIKDILNSIAVCFSMYSAIPMPKINWDKANMKYVFCFFPFVGLIVGGTSFLWYKMAIYLELSELLYAAIAVIIPVVLTGGIHIDGYIDTCDATFSYGDREKKLQILKDPHVGAFGIIYIIVYFVLMLGLYGQLFTGFTQAAMLIFIFPLSRAISGLIAVNCASARTSGLQHMFAAGTKKVAVNAVLILWVVLLFALLANFSLMFALIVAATVGVYFAWFNFSSKKNFGGITGDLVGFSLCVIELILVAALVVTKWVL